ncbi:MAG: C10 family peptidase [Alistipes sp.]|nr:C10 family peptidase [Alistipes sp.]
MKKIFYCLVAAFVLAACVKEDVSIAKVEEVKNPYAVTPDEAVQLLKTVIGGEFTRAVSVGEIKTLRKSDFVPTTRGAEDGDVIYIVDLENGGSAVMGADKRMEPIYAILDETKVTPDKLTLTATRSDDGEQDIEEYVMGLVNAKISSDFAALRPPLIDTLPIPSLRSEFWNETTVLGQVEPMLMTKWEQKSIYNDVIAMNTGNPDTPAGCAVIAISQIMAYHRMGIIGRSYNWDIINSFVPGYVNIASEGEKTYMANYIYEVRCGITSSLTDGINIREVRSFLRNDTNYYDNDIYDYSRARVVNMLENDKPVYTRGMQSDLNEGHAWVIDGYYQYRVDEWERSYIGQFIDEERIVATYNYDLLHCNYGWGGSCDGYYTQGTFDTTNRLASDRIDTAIGDVGCEGDYNFTVDIQIIQYSK